jgi:hypothetical protein
MRALALKADQPVDRLDLAGDDAEGRCGRWTCT